jgi:S-adenosylmethionine:tRNA ribosyltransferase-isomerase
MKLSQFKFKLPEELIAQYPAKHRDEARLMVVHKDTGNIEHRVFKDVLDYFNENDLFVFNDTMVFPARLYGNKEKTGAQIEVFLLRELNPEMRLWDVLVEPARKIRIGNKLYFGEDDSIVAEVIDNTTSRGRTLRFLFDGTHDEFKKALFALEKHRCHVTLSALLNLLMQNISNHLCQKRGSCFRSCCRIAFSRELLKRMEIKGIDMAFLTSHMSLGIFRDIDVEDLTKHKMDSEQILVPDETAEKVNKAHDENRNICAVGVTVMRALETVAGTDVK